MIEALLILILLMNVILLVLFYLSVSGLAGTIKGQKTINEQQQVLSDQLTDLEETLVETKGDVRKLSQQFINYAKGKQVAGDKPWYS